MWAHRVHGCFAQVGQWKFLGFSGEFSTTLYVHQDKKAGKASTTALCIKCHQECLDTVVHTTQTAGTVASAFKAPDNDMRNFMEPPLVQSYMLD